MTQSEAEPMFPILAVYLIHGIGDSRNASVNKLQAVLEQHWPGLNLFAPTYLSMTPEVLPMLQSKSSCG